MEKTHGHVYKYKYSLFFLFCSSCLADSIRMDLYNLRTFLLQQHQQLDGARMELKKLLLSGLIRHSCRDWARVRSHLELEMVGTRLTTPKTMPDNISHI